MLPLNRMMRRSKMAVSAEALTRKSYVRPVQHSLPLLALPGSTAHHTRRPLEPRKRTLLPGSQEQQEGGDTLAPAMSGQGYADPFYQPSNIDRCWTRWTCLSPLTAGFW